MSEDYDKRTKELLEKISKNLDLILVILLAKSGLKQSEIAKIIGTSERTIRNWIPFRQIQQSGKHNEEN